MTGYGNTFSWGSKRKPTTEWTLSFKVLTNIKILTVIVIDIILKPPKLDAS